MIEQHSNNTVEDVMAYANDLGFGEVHTKIDAKTNLLAIVAIHSTKLGPALGGCRCLPYPTLAAGMKDALRLARGMSLKAAMAELAYGGGKSVLIRPETIADRDAYFTAFGQFVDHLSGRYITAIDSGTSQKDMDTIGKKTRYVSSKSDQGDPSAYTARGVFYAIQAAVRHKYKRDDLKGLHAAIQGAGHVGYLLAKDLFEHGVSLTVCDTQIALAEQCAQEFNAAIVRPEEIYTIPCDIFAPCALGGILNSTTIPMLQTPLVVGAANNQLGDDYHGIELHQRDILYVPDYVVNAGGLIRVVMQYEGKDYDAGLPFVKKIYNRIQDLLIRAEQEHKPTSVLCDEIALQKLQ